MIPPLHLIILVNSLTQMEGLKGKIKYSEDSQTLSVSLLVYFQSRSLDILSSGHLAIFGIFQMVPSIARWKRMHNIQSQVVSYEHNFDADF